MSYSGCRIVVLLVSALLHNLCWAGAKVADDIPQVQLLAPGYGELDFEAPKAGSYELPALGFAKDAKVLNVDGEQVRFHDLYAGKYTLLSFMYSRCGDVNGCPLTHVVFNRIRQIASNNPGLDKHLQLISMSFDPENDTPEVLKNLNSGHADHDQHSGHAGHEVENKERIEWLYLTSDSDKSLEPILVDYDQAVLNDIDEEGNATGRISHILRVYLIDPRNQIRNIYSVPFLHPDIIINDVKTLLLGDNISLVNEAAKDNKEGSVRIGPGDDKSGYHSVEYKTDSVSLLARKGIATDLMRLVNKPPLGLPKVPVPEDNPVSKEKILLGKKLFYDRRLSLNSTISCAMCHIPEQGFTSNELKKPVGFEGRSVRRNAPTIYNTAYSKRLFHDARETSLENQIWQPLTARNEMAMPSIGMVVEKIRGLSDYSGLFERALGGKKADVVTIGQAISSYERTLISGGSPFDQWYFAKEENTISESAKRGFDLFKGKAQCVVCHTIKEDHALFTDNKLHNTGIGWELSMRKKPEEEEVQVSPGNYISLKQSAIDAVGHEPLGDLGFYEITQKPEDRWRYKTPMLRNLTLTAPYMHDGSLSSLNDVVEFYNHGGFKNETQSPLIKPLKLSKSEVNDLVEFLKSLTGDNVEEIVLDAFSTPVGDIHATDQGSVQKVSVQ